MKKKEQENLKTIVIVAMVIIFFALAYMVYGTEFFNKLSPGAVYGSNGCYADRDWDGQPYDPNRIIYYSGTGKILGYGTTSESYYARMDKFPECQAQAPAGTPATTTPAQTAPQAGTPIITDIPYTPIQTTPVQTSATPQQTTNYEQEPLLNSTNIFIVLLVGLLGYAAYTTLYVKRGK